MAKFSYQPNRISIWKMKEAGSVQQMNLDCISVVYTTLF